MQTKASRGRPRGKYRSPADFRLLQYIALISMKFEIDSEKFFDSFVEAWKRRESTCESLSIRCRKKTRENAVFIITKGSKVVAQFPISKHILEEANPIKGFGPARASRSTMLKRAEANKLRIGDLMPGMNRVNLKARVIEIPKPRSVVTRFGGFAKITNASIADETGIIQLPLWNRQIDTVSVGDLVRVENARVVKFRGESQLRVSRGGQLSIVEKR